MDAKQHELLRSLVNDLTGGNIGGILESGRNGRLTDGEIRAVLLDCPGTLTEIPSSKFDAVSYFPRTGNEDSKGSAEINLWMDGEESDLTLLVDFERVDGEWTIAIDDIHVL